MVFVVNRFAEQDKESFFDLWDTHDPWGKENDRPDIAESNWIDVISGTGPLYGLALRDTKTSKTIGFVLYRYNVSSKTPRHECHVCDIFVDERFRKQNGATQMLNAVIEDAKKNNSSRICWVSNPKRAESTAFYNTFPAEKRERSCYTMWLE